MNPSNTIQGKKALRTVLVAAALTLTPPFAAPQATWAESLQQTQQVIRGNVVDENGEAVIGATIVVVGGSAAQGTVTDFDGNFSIKAKPGAKLKISYIGYVTKTVTASRDMHVTLKEEATSLQGVEVVAYGVQKKVTVTGALSSVKGDDLLRTPVSSVNNVLAGQLSGVTTVQYSGEPGSDAATIFVRGKGTWVDSNPLVQIDGVDGSLDNIDPNEIESITVLKDASATAVFGVRGANGVILITTKRGQEGKARIAASTNFSILVPNRLIKQASSYDYAMFYNQMDENDGSGHRFSDAVIQKFRDGSDPIRFPNSQWTDYIMKKSTLQTQSNLSISGGTKAVKYFISAGMYTTGGLFKQFDQSYVNDFRYHRFNYRANIDINVTKTTTLSANLNGIVDEAKKPYNGQGSAGIIKYMYYSTPFSSPGIVDGRYIINSASTKDNLDGNVLPFVGGDPLGNYYGRGFMNTNRNYLSMDLQLKQDLGMITKGLSWHAKGSYHTDYYVYKNGSASVATYNPIWKGVDENGKDIFGYRKNGDTTEPGFSESRGKSRQWYFETAFNYNRSFGLHTITALALYNQSQQYYPGTYSDIRHGLLGFVGRVTYDWNNCYMAEFNVGYNGSENFAPSKRFGFFPAGSLGWVTSDEPFFKPIKKVVSFLKLRASWGLVGNDRIGGTRFMYLPDAYNVNQGALFNRTGKDGGSYGYNFGVENGTTKQGAIEAQKNNPDVTWEKAFKQDYGFDIRFLRDKLETSFDYYREHRTDILLIDQTAPTTLGFSLPAANLGEAKSWGYEISVTWNDKIGKDFRYWIKGNLSYNQNKVVERKEAPQTNEYQYQKNHRIGARSQYKFWKFYYEGCEQDYMKEFGVTSFPTQMVANLKPGDAVYVDLDRNGKIDGDDASYDYGFTDDPQYIAGLNLGMQWKNFSFSAQLTGAWNVSRMLSDIFRQPFYSSNSTTEGGLLQFQVDNTWTSKNPSQSAEYPRATWANAAQNYATSTLYEKDAKYLRLKTIQVAYDFHFPLMKTLGLNQLQLALSAYNLFTVTPYKWGDPETRASNAPSYPLNRTYTASLKVAF